MCSHFASCLFFPLRFASAAFPDCGTIGEFVTISEVSTCKIASLARECGDREGNAPMGLKDLV